MINILSNSFTNSTAKTRMRFKWAIYIRAVQLFSKRGRTSSYGKHRRTSLFTDLDTKNKIFLHHSRGKGYQLQLPFFIPKFRIHDWNFETRIFTSSNPKILVITYSKKCYSEFLIWIRIFWIKKGHSGNPGRE